MISDKPPPPAACKCIEACSKPELSVSPCCFVSGGVALSEAVRAARPQGQRQAVQAHPSAAGVARAGAARRDGRMRQLWAAGGGLDAAASHGRPTRLPPSRPVSPLLLRVRPSVRPLRRRPAPPAVAVRTIASLCACGRRPCTIRRRTSARWVGARYLSAALSRCLSLVAAPGALCRRRRQPERGVAAFWSSQPAGRAPAVSHPASRSPGGREAGRGGREGGALWPLR